MSQLVTGHASKTEEPWTIGRLLVWTTDFLRRRGSDSPRLDAEVMLAHVMEWERVQLYTHYTDEVGERDRRTLRELVRRRVQGAPVAYLVGRKEFYSLSFEVSPVVLIPRPESEFVVVEFLEVMKSNPAPRAVDVGTGSGCLAIASARSHPGSQFIGIDISADALDLARTNSLKHHLEDRIEFRLGNLLDPVASEEPFDVIMSNPPYIPTGVIATLEPGVRDFEPHVALDGGQDGLAVVSTLINQAIPLLKPGGELILEIGSEQEVSVRAMISSRPEFEICPTIIDLEKHPRVIRATRSRIS